MARPCGCAGECSCTYLGVNGITVSGPGTSRDPVRIGLANPLAGLGCDAVMSCVGTRLGGGLRYNASSRTIFASISGDGGNSLTFGTDGGLYTASGGAGGDSGGATVDGLAALTTPIVGGSYGAGNSIWAEGPIDTYQAAMSMALQMIHVPVRRSREYFLWAQHYRTLSKYNAQFGGQTTDSTDLIMAPHMWYTPGGAPTGTWQDPKYAALQGYFGAGARDRHGMPRLGDIFGLVQRRSVLYLQIMDLGASVNDVPAPQNTIGNLRTLIAQYGNHKNVIVGSQFPTAASSADLNAIQGALSLIRDYGIAIAAHINTKAEADALLPAALVANGYKWVFVHYSLVDSFPATVKAYKDAGLNVMVADVHRQYQWAALTNAATFGPGGLKGALCWDPVYASGITTGYRYRSTKFTLEYGTPDYGRHSPWSGTMDGQRDYYRGYVNAGQPGLLSLEGEVVVPGQALGDPAPSAYYILMGEQCPAYVNPDTGKQDNYDIEVGFVFSQIQPVKQDWIGVWFGNPEDRPLLDNIRCNEFTRGYVFLMNQAGLFSLQRYDGVPKATVPAYAYSSSWDSPWKDNVIGFLEYRVKIRVRPNRIIVGPANQIEGGTHTRTFDINTGRGDLWRGGYVWLGRADYPYTGDFAHRVQWLNLTLTPAS